MESHRHSYRNSHDLKRSCSLSNERGTDVKRVRSRSPNREGHHYRSSKRFENAAQLPFHAHHLQKRDLDANRALLGSYLDIQKDIDIAELREDEVKGRWKSFLGKWNRGELAEGWYDPSTKQKADERQNEQPARERCIVDTSIVVAARQEVEKSPESDEEDDGYGPALPEAARHRAGPAIPRAQDLQLRAEQDEEDREIRIADARYDRKQDRNLQKERIEELAPRADPGSRERLLERKRETTATNREFRDAKGGGEVEIKESDLMGDDGDDFKKKRKELSRKKNEREIRKEEILLARAAEREERLGKARRKEDKTMEMLKEMARQRFG
ncbi:hypothetical protein LTR62_001856 [Meristemomyces frigidus]|uniref:Uncharacterized protein n=1 Tax=Meristemomyces frigidus TaxID=1508187 RepID=A0AAN7YG27_9PEZI|nr:hypothetical protein LTR62_001856 [Meristemomyces frigidus]